MPDDEDTKQARHRGETALYDPHPHLGEPQRHPAVTVGANLARGALMGSFDVVPGVSGGTVALVVGIYERLIASIRAIVDVVLSVLRGDVPRAKARLAEVEWWLVIPLGIGILAAIVTLARVIEPLLEEDTGHPEEARAVFFGLIIGSLVVPWRRGGGIHDGRWLLVLGGAAVAFVLSGMPDTEIDDPALVAVFFSAMLAICAMILPGVSGSFILLAIGMYAPTIAAVNDRDVVYVLVFAAGAAIGLGGFSKLLNWLLTHRHDATMAVLLGLMLGSLRAVWPWLDEDRGLEAPPGGTEWLPELGLALAAFAFVTAVITIARRLVGDEAVFGTPQGD